MLAVVPVGITQTKTRDGAWGVGGRSRARRVGGDQRIRDDFTLIKYARTDIVHKGKIAPNADRLAGIARMYVDLAIHTRVREAIQAAARPTTPLYVTPS
jgi:hypothetical protein